MKRSIVTALFAGSGVLMLSACGGGGGGEGTGGVMGVTAANFIGVNAETGANPRNVTLIQTTAALNAKAGLSADFDGYTFEADSGFENGTAVENGNTVGLLSDIDTGISTDLILFDGAYDDGSGVTAIYYGITGAAPTDDLRTSGSATWTGRGFADIVGTSGTTDLGVGTATVTATFPGTVSAEIAGFSGPVDTVMLSKMNISGDRFVGSSVATSDAGSPVNVVGSAATGNVEGIFSGSQDAAGTPDEIGGIFTLTGSDATLIGGFVAD